MLILTDGSEVGRLGDDECSLTFSAWTSLAASSVSSLLFVNTGLSPLVEDVGGLRVGEAADDGASTALLLGVEGDAWKRGGDSLP